MTNSVAGVSCLYMVVGENTMCCSLVMRYWVCQMTGIIGYKCRHQSISTSYYQPCEDLEVIDAPYKYWYKPSGKSMRFLMHLYALTSHVVAEANIGGWSHRSMAITIPERNPWHVVVEGASSAFMNRLCVAHTPQKRWSTVPLALDLA